MTKLIKRYDNFSFGVVDRKFLARTPANGKDMVLRDHAFEEATNTWVSNAGSIIPRPGTRLIKDFGDNAMIKCFSFARGENQQYLLVFSQGKQEIFYIDTNGYLVEAKEDEVEQSLVPNDLTSNTAEGYNIVSTAAKTDAYTIFGDTGLGTADVYTIDITFPNPISLFRVVMDIGSCAVLQGTFYKSTGESWVASAHTESTTYPARSCGGSTCRSYYVSGYVNKSQHTFEFPSGEYAYNDIKRVVLVAKSYESYTSGNFPTNYTSSWRLANGYLKKISIFGTTTTGQGAVWHEDIPVDKIEQASYDFTNRYLFFAQRDIPPYVVSVFGAFTFAQLTATFPEEYNFTTMGYPDVVCCGQSRLWFAGFSRETTSIIGSSVGYNLDDLRNFKPTVENNVVLPSSAVKFQPTDIRNKINWAIAANALNFASWDGIFKMTYGNDQPISATGAVVIKQNEEASGRVLPAWYNGMMCFASMGRDELRLMDYNLQRERQYSINISRYSNDLNSKKIKKLVFKKDNNSNLFVLYEDGTAAQVRILDEKAAGFFPFSVLDGIQDILTGKGDNGDRIYFVVKNGTRTQLVLMDEIDYPKVPAIDYENLQQTMSDMSLWLYQKSIMDSKVYLEDVRQFSPSFEVSQIQTTNPPEVNNLIDTYPQWVALKNPPYGETNFSAYVGNRLFCVDDNTHWNFYVDIYSMPRTDGTTGVYYAWVPVGDAFDMKDVLYTTSTTNLSRATTYSNINGVFHDNSTAAVATTSGADTITVNSMSGILGGQPGTEYKRAPAKDVDQNAFIFGVPSDPEDPHWLANIDPDAGAPAYYGWTLDLSSTGASTHPSVVFTTSTNPPAYSFVYDENKNLISSHTGTIYTNCTYADSDGSTISITSWDSSSSIISGGNVGTYNRAPNLDVAARGAYVYAVSARQAYVGIQTISLAYQADNFALFSEDRYLGTYCGSGLCGNNVSRIDLDEPVARVVYGVPYEVKFKIGYVMNDAAYARRLVSTLSVNTANSWGLKIGTESSDGFQEAYYAMLLGLPFANDKIKTLVDMYNADNNIYGLNPVPMKPFVQLNIEDTWSDYKAIVVEQSIPYPFEIFSIEATLEENNSERGQQ